MRDTPWVAARLLAGALDEVETGHVPSSLAAILADLDSDDSRASSRDVTPAREFGLRAMSPRGFKSPVTSPRGFNAAAPSPPGLESALTSPRGSKFQVTSLRGSSNPRVILAEKSQSSHGREAAEALADILSDLDEEDISFEFQGFHVPGRNASQGPSRPPERCLTTPGREEVSPFEPMGRVPACGVRSPGPLPGQRSPPSRDPSHASDQEMKRCWRRTSSEASPYRMHLSQPEPQWTECHQPCRDTGIRPLSRTTALKKDSTVAGNDRLAAGGACNARSLRQGTNAVLDPSDEEDCKPPPLARGRTVTTCDQLDRHILHPVGRPSTAAVGNRQTSPQPRVMQRSNTSTTRSTWSKDARLPPGAEYHSPNRSPGMGQGSLHAGMRPRALQVSRSISPGVGLPSAPQRSSPRLGTPGDSKGLLGLSSSHPPANRTRSPVMPLGSTRSDQSNLSPWQERGRGVDALPRCKSSKGLPSEHGLISPLRQARGSRPEAEVLPHAMFSEHGHAGRHPGRSPPGSFLPRMQSATDSRSPQISPQSWCRSPRGHQQRSPESRCSPIRADLCSTVPAGRGYIQGSKEWDGPSHLAVRRGVSPPPGRQASPPVGQVLRIQVRGMQGKRTGALGEGAQKGCLDHGCIDTRHTSAHAWVG